MVKSNMTSLSSLQGIGNIQYEGKHSKNPFAFKYYNPSEKIGGKTMKDHLRFSVAYWHTLTADGTDMFGTGTMKRAWDSYSGMDLAKARLKWPFSSLIYWMFRIFHSMTVILHQRATRFKRPISS